MCLTHNLLKICATMRADLRSKEKRRKTGRRTGQLILDRLLGEIRGEKPALQEEGFHGGLGLADELPLLADSAVKFEGPGGVPRTSVRAPRPWRKSRTSLASDHTGSGSRRRNRARHTSGCCGPSRVAGQKDRHVRAAVVTLPSCGRLLTLQPGKMRIRWSWPRPILIAQARSNPSPCLGRHLVLLVGQGLTTSSPRQRNCLALFELACVVTTQSPYPLTETSLREVKPRRWPRVASHSCIRV